MAAKKSAPKATKVKKPAAAKPATKKAAPVIKKPPPKPAAEAVKPNVVMKPSKAPAKAPAKAPESAVEKPAKKAVATAQPPAPPPAPARKATRTAGADHADDADASDNLLAGPRNVQPYVAKRGEQYMSKEQLTHFRKILHSWKQDLMMEVDRTVSHMKDEAANFPDPADRATQEEEFSLELRTRDRERKLIKKIESTLELIDQDDYGYCDACGVEIGINRLEARPTATLCIDCKTLEEIKERQEHG